MNIKRELIAAAVRILAENTTLVRKPDSIEMWFDTFLGNESYDRRIAKNLEVEAARAAEVVKRCHTNIKFKRIISKI